MACTMIAFGGKGGSGKTTLTALLLRELIRAGRGPVLAVDADPNATLPMALGVEVPETIADLRDRMGEAAQRPNQIPKDRLMDQWLTELLSENSGFDLLVMGRPEGPKCYCYVNGLLRRYLKLLRDNYPIVLVDCEAGMEYLSRLTMDDVDALVMVAEPTPVGLTSARRIAALADSLPITVHRRILVLNKVKDPVTFDPKTWNLGDLHAVVHMPYDTDLANRWAQGLPLDEQAAPDARSAIQELTNHCLGLSQQATFRKA